MISFDSHGAILLAMYVISISKPWFGEVCIGNPDCAADKVIRASSEKKFASSVQ